MPKPSTPSVLANKTELAKVVPTANIRNKKVPKNTLNSPEFNILVIFIIKVQSLLKNLIFHGLHLI